MNEIKTKLGNVTTGFFENGKIYHVNYLFFLGELLFDSNTEQTPDTRMREPLHPFLSPPAASESI